MAGNPRLNTNIILLTWEYLALMKHKSKEEVAIKRDDRG
ncbi:hypothetical protein PALA111701_27930 [Paenibacillus lactis]|jgi:hypothetical protein